jgi:transcriptional regulator with XRE-family HTH domain
MATKGKRETKTGTVPPLCAAVKQVRETYGETLQRFGQRVNLSMNTLNRFELGKAEPRDPDVLMRLWSAAIQRSLPQADLFLEAANEARHARSIEQWQTPDPRDARSVLAMSLSQWRVLEAVSLAWESYPEVLPAVGDALAPVLEVVDAVLNTVHDPSRVDYRDLKHRIRQLADQQILKDIQMRKKEGQ